MLGLHGLGLDVDAEGDAVAEYVDALFHDCVVGGEILNAVSDPVDREHLEEMQDVRNRFFLEDIRPCHEYFRLSIRNQDRERVHQGVGMVRGEDHRTVLRDSVQIPAFDLPVAHRKGHVQVPDEEIVESAVILNLTHGIIWLK